MNIISEILRPMPKVLYLEPYFGCNYRCRFCIHGGGHQITHVQLGVRAFEHLKPLIEKTSHVHMTGLGEPFLNANLADYLAYFGKNGKSYYINTNGSLVEDAHIDLMTASPSELAVSLDAGDRKTYETVRCGGNWDRVLARVKRVSRMKAERNSPYPLLYLSFHINALNLTSLNTMPELARDLGIDAVKLSWTQLPQGSRDHSVFGNQDTVNHLLRDVTSQLHASGIHVTNEARFRKHARGCWNLTEMAFVRANGAVAACCSRWIPVGNIHDNGFEDIWNGAARRRLALGIVNGCPEPECRDCRQIRGADYAHNEEDFFKPTDLDLAVPAEKTKNIGPLPSLEGLDAHFRSGVASLMGGDLQAAAGIFSALESKFPDFFEIKNNLAAAYCYLGDLEKSREVLNSIRSIPHNWKLVQWNHEFLQRSWSGAS
ncbi:MAG: radical SAM protein [Thermodesulfobacteriota bacterium]